MKHKFYIDRLVNIWHRELHEIEGDSYEQACKIATNLSDAWDSDSRSSCLSTEFLEQTADFGHAFGNENIYVNKIEVICNTHGHIIFEK
jgi:hypothetical protein